MNTSSDSDAFYSHEKIARISARFITHLFACPETAPDSQHKLPYFIAYALHRTKLHPTVTYSALVLLQRLKARFPTAQGLSGHRLFTAAYMTALKNTYQGTGSNMLWVNATQRMFGLQEFDEMERELYIGLDGDIQVDDEILANFRKALERDFGQDREKYPDYPYSMVSRKAARDVVPNLPSTASDTPTFIAQRNPAHHEAMFF